MSFNEQRRQDRSHRPIITPPSNPLHHRSSSYPHLTPKRISFADTPADQPIGKNSDDEING